MELFPKRGASVQRRSSISDDMSNIGAFNFTIEDVRKQLNILGYSSIPNDKLSEFAEGWSCTIILIENRSDFSYTHFDYKVECSRFISRLPI